MKNENIEIVQKYVLENGFYGNDKKDLIIEMINEDRFNIINKNTGEIRQFWVADEIPVIENKTQIEKIFDLILLIDEVHNMQFTTKTSDAIDEIKLLCKDILKLV